MSSTSIPQKVCILGAAFRNKGAEAMLLTTARHIRNVYPHARIYVRLRPSEYKLGRAHGFHPLPRAIGNKSNLLTTALRKLQTYMVYRKSSLLLDVGGYQFGDPWAGTHKFRKHARTARQLQSLGTPVIYLPQAWGPFSDPASSASVTTVVKSSRMAYVRDKISWSYMTTLLGAPPPNLAMAPDIAWNFTPSTSKTSNFYLPPKLKLPDPTTIKLVCVTPNLRIFEKPESMHGGMTYVQTMASLIDALTVDTSVHILLLGHELSSANDPRPDDRLVAKQILQACRNKGQISVSDETSTAEEIKSIIGLCEFIISSRFHCLIASLSQNIPAVAVGWSHKYDELMADAGLPDHQLPLDADRGLLRKQLLALWNRRETSASVLHNTVPALKASASRPLDLALDVIAGGKGSA